MQRQAFLFYGFLRSFSLLAGGGNGGFTKEGAANKENKQQSGEYGYAD
ncbi:hypothetical protein GCM10027423_07010 [Spirosoma arcticum]